LVGRRTASAGVVGRRTLMAAGDAHRVWFAEMVDDLRLRWSPSLPWDDVVRLCEDAMALRKRIRQARGIQPPRTRCRRCGTVSQVDIPGISVRSLLFAARNEGLIDDAQLASLDRSWKKHRSANDLDAYGRALRERPTSECWRHHNAGGP
jgi:hypothetical protein